jgi:hypothetical protein
MEQSQPESEEKPLPKPYITKISNFDNDPIKKQLKDDMIRYFEDQKPGENKKKCKTCFEKKKNCKLCVRSMNNSISQVSRHAIREYIINNLNHNSQLYINTDIDRKMINYMTAYDQKKESEKKDKNMGFVLIILLILFLVGLFLYKNKDKYNFKNLYNTKSSVSRKSFSSSPRSLKRS